MQASEDVWGDKLRELENHYPDSVTCPTLASGPNSGGFSQEVGGLFAQGWGFPVGNGTAW